MMAPDLQQIMISRNLTLAEVVRSSSHPELQIDPNDFAGQDVVNFMRLTHEFLQLVRDRFDHPLIVTSWARSLALEAALGITSRLRRHLRALAADFYIHDIPAPIVLREIARHPRNLMWDRLCLYPAEHRFHVDTRPWEEGPPRKLFYIDWVEVSTAEALQFSTAGIGPPEGGGAK